MKVSSVDRVRRALREAGHADTIIEFPQGTRSAQDAASAVGCSISQIVKSMVFRYADRPVLILTSGTNRVDESKVSQLIGENIGRADGRWVREITGFAIGGVAPVGHISPAKILIDEDLMAYSQIWAAAGSPMKVFRTSGEKLVKMTGGMVAEIRKLEP